MRSVFFAATLLLFCGCNQASSPVSSIPSDSLGTGATAVPDSQNELLANLQRTLSTLKSQQDSIQRALSDITGSLPGGISQDRAGSEALVNPGAVLETAGEAIQNFGLRMFFALLVVLLTWNTVRGAIYLLERRAEKNAKRRLFYKRLVPIIRIVCWALAITFIIRGIFQVDARGFLTAAAAIGVAIGFAAQDVLKNIFGGLVIIFDQPFQVGDKISVGGAYGEVSSIGLRSTRIVTPDDNLVSVPNSQVVDGQVSNANAGALDCQVVTDMYLPGWVDEARAKEIAYQAAASSKYVYLKKPIVVLVKDVFDHTFLTRIRVKAYVLDIRHEFAFMSDVTERARAQYRREGMIQPTYGARPGDIPRSGGDGQKDTEVIASIGEDSHEYKDA